MREPDHLPPGRRWLLFAVGAMGIAAFVVLLHLGSTQLDGDMGRMIADNREHDREVYAYFYSELGDLEDFLDDENGRYGRAALGQALICPED